MSPVSRDLRVPAPDLDRPHLAGVRAAARRSPRRTDADADSSKAARVAGASRSQRAPGPRPGRRTSAATCSTSASVGARAAAQQHEQRAARAAAPLVRRSPQVTGAPPLPSATAATRRAYAPANDLHPDGRPAGRLPWRAWLGWRSSAPGWAVSPRRRGWPRPDTGSPSLEQAERSAASSAGSRGTGTPSTPGRAWSRCRRSTATCSPRPAGRSRTPSTSCRLDPAVALPVRRRHAAGRARATAEAIPGALDDALGAGAGAQWTALLERAARMWRISESPFLRTPAAGRGDAGAAGPRPGRRRGDRAVADAARARRAAPARPAPADAARPLRDLLRLRPAAGAGRAGDGAVRGADVRLLVRARRAAPARPWRWPSGRPSAGAVVRTGLRGAPGARRGRPGGRASSWPTASGVAADVVVSGADAAALYGDLLPADRRTRRRAPGPGRATPSLSGFVLLLALRGRTPGLAHHTVLFPDDYDAEFDAVFGTGRFRGARGRSPTRPSTSAHRTTRRCAPTRTASPGSCSSTPPGTTRRAGSTGTSPALADRYADRVLDVMAAPRARRARPGALARRPHAGRPRARHRQRRRLDLRDVEQRGPRRLPAPGQRLPVPGLFLVGGSAHPGGGLPLVRAVRRDRRRAHRSGLTARRPRVRGSSRAYGTPCRSGGQREPLPLGRHSPCRGLSRFAVAWKLNSEQAGPSVRFAVPAPRTTPPGVGHRGRSRDTSASRRRPPLHPEHAGGACCPRVRTSPSSPSAAMGTRSSRRPSVRTLTSSSSTSPCPGCPACRRRDAVLSVRPDARIILLTANLAVAAVKEAQEIGLAGYLLKGQDPDALVRHVRAVASGGTAWGGEVLASVPHQGQTSASEHDGSDHGERRHGEGLPMAAPI